MANAEFALIQRFFASRAGQRADVALGIGDDAALLRPSPSEVLVATVDTMVAGAHFLADAAPAGIGHKALAVNLSDLAAMGAAPAWATLALTLPAVDEPWLTGFCEGFFALAERFDVQLVGGDVTRGPLTITVQVHGFVSEPLALRRDGARPGDVVCVTGFPGDAGLALAIADDRAHVPAAQLSYLQDRLERPMPRIRQGIDLRELASAAIDISDGLAQDLGHILTRSGVGARLDVDKFPRSPALAACADTEMVLQAILAGGDDYELCFTAPPEQLARIQALAADWDCACSEIGIIQAEPGLRCQYADGTPYPLAKLGYDHFG